MIPHRSNTTLLPDCGLKCVLALFQLHERKAETHTHTQRKILQGGAQVSLLQQKEERFLWHLKTNKFIEALNLISNLLKHNAYASFVMSLKGATRLHHHHHPRKVILFPNYQPISLWPDWYFKLWDHPNVALHIMSSHGKSARCGSKSSIQKGWRW